MCSDETQNDLRSMEVLKGQCDTYWTNFDRRRAYEWKLSLAIWTALAAFVALTLQDKVTVSLEYKNVWLASVFIVLIGGIAGFFVVLIQWNFQKRVKLANDVDKRKAELYEERLNQMLNISYYNNSGQISEKEKEVGKAINEVRPSNGDWSAGIHVSITIILIVLVIIMGCSKVHLDCSRQKKKAISNTAVMDKEVLPQPPNSLAQP